MSATCPNGHVSATDDYCDQCGAPIAAAPGGGGPIPAAPTPHPGAATPPIAAPAAPPEPATGGDEVETSAAARAQPCPQCGAPRTGDDRYCEGCGYDFVAAAPPVAPPVDAAGSQNGPSPAGAMWEAVASADREQFDRIAPASLEFPADYGERHFPLAGAAVSIGRTHSPDNAPDINLAGAPEDPAVSHRHAVLELQPDGSYKLRDLGSTNGTTLNDDPSPISGDVGAPVADGDRIHIGAWTTITVRKKT
jgi:hypothetical protein